MIIAITGLTAAGKNTLGELVAQHFGYKMICPTFKDLAKDEGISLMEFQKKAEKNHNIDKKFDDFLKKESTKGDCVITTWLGPWMVKSDLSVNLFAPLDVRAKRLAKRDKIGLEEAKKHVTERDEQNRKRYLDIYRIDIFDTTNFDISLSSSTYSPDQLKMIIIEILKIKK